jgi:hypothetical protein
LNVVWFLASQQIDQPGAAGWPPQLADLGGELAVAGLLRLRYQLLAPLDEVIGGDAVELVGSGIEIHGSA